MLALRADSCFDGERFRSGPVTVLVDGGRIVGVEDGRPELGEPWTVVDHGTATLLPGLVDAHVHLAADGDNGALERLAGQPAESLPPVIGAALWRHLASGVTAVRDLGDRDFAVLAYRDQRPAGSGPAIVASGPPLTTVGGHCAALGGHAEGVDQLREAVRERARRGADVVKVMATGGVMTPGTDVGACQFTLAEMRAIVDEAHAAGLPVVAHAHALEAVRQVAEAGVDGVEHCSCVTDHGVDMPEDLAAALAASGIAVDPTLGWAPVPDAEFARAVLADAGLVWDDALRMVGRAHAAGVRLIAGTDGGIGAFKPHGILPDALREFVAAGIPLAAALIAGTSAAAEACGLGGTKGRLRAGFDADLVVVGGTLREDIGALGLVERVYLGGAKVDFSRA